jgi:putative DNA primase/helicase
MNIPQSPFEIFLAYFSRGYSVIPVPYRQKNPARAGWQNLRITPENAAEYFKAEPVNFGLLTGEPSGWIVDVDLDHELAIQMAAEHLPATPAVFGRPSRPRSHRLYRSTGPINSMQIRSITQGMVVELRAANMQTIIPPSVHVSGELIEWEEGGEEPAFVNPQELVEAVRRLGNAVKVQLGEPAGGNPPRMAQPCTSANLAAGEVSRRQTPSPGDAVERCLRAMERIRRIDQKDGSLRLLMAARCTVEHDLEDATALIVIRRYEQARPFPRQWSDAEVLQRVHDAEKVSTRGTAFSDNRDEQGQIMHGTPEPESGRLVLSLDSTRPSAEAFMRQFYGHPDRCRLVNFSGALSQWTANRYVRLEDREVSKQLFPWLEEALRYGVNGTTTGSRLIKYGANPSRVNAILDTIKSLVHLRSETPSHSWLDTTGDRPPADEVLVGRSTLLHLPSRDFLPTTPLFFTTNALDYDPDLTAPEPTAWLNFLRQLFEDDAQSINLLQEWFGYVLTPDTSLQKMLFMVGPPRSGKSTIARVLTSLVGPANVCSPPISSLVQNFGLQTLLGKTLAIVGDARFGNENNTTVVERLLSISGEDNITIDRKFMPSVTLRLPARFMLLANELPRVRDASGAFAGRLLIVPLTRSFRGMEDTRLTSRLLCELPSILNWAIEGWDRLHNRGCFQEPETGMELAREFADMGSPVGAFVRERCIIEASRRANFQDLFGAWSAWCEIHHTVIGTRQSFGRDLHAAVPGLNLRRGTGQESFYTGLEIRQGRVQI